jgi:hypothetical protein
MFPVTFVVLRNDEHGVLKCFAGARKATGCPARNYRASTTAPLRRVMAYAPFVSHLATNCQRLMRSAASGSPSDRGSHPHRRLRRLGEVASWSGAPLPPGCVAGVDRVSQRPSLHDAHFFESRSNDPTTTGRCNYNYSWPHRRRRSLIRGRRSLAEQIAPLSSRRTLGAAFRIGGSGGMLHVMQTHHLRARCAARKGRRSTRRLARR